MFRLLQRKSKRLLENGGAFGSLRNRNLCGLVAAVDNVWSANGAQLSDASGLLTNESQLKDTTCILHHRGPDGYQVAQGVLGANKTRWAMGHTRLAIVDPSNRFADMPFHFQFTNTKGEEKIIHLAANGEIYNHEKLYAQLVGEHGWQHNRISGSDCEVIGHAYVQLGGPATAASLDGMFAWVIFEEDVKTGQVKCFAARDPVGIKPLYYGKSSSGDTYLFASELKALVGRVEPSSVVAIPPGHYWTPEEGLVCYYNPDWLRKDDYAPWEDPNHIVTDDEVREAFSKAVQKRMMADVDYGLFLSGGVDSCIVGHDLLPLFRAEREKMGDDRPIPAFTVGMRDSPDVMAAKGMVDALGGEKYVDHRVREFTPDCVFDIIPKIIYHMETYEAELIRSSIPNWLLAERAAQDVKMVLTGEGADELFAGYLYFQDAQSPRQVQNELRRIYSMLGNINLHRTDRMTMAHGLEARVPFLDTEFTRLAMSIDPAKKMVDPQAVLNNSRGREKTLLRELFEGPNANGHSIPRPVLWRSKAMQCEGVGEDWVSILQGRIAALVSDAELADAAITYPVNTPHTKEELYYRKIYDSHFHGMEHVVKLWEGGGRAMGAEWKSDMYTREGLKNTSMLSHALQEKSVRAFSTSTKGRSFSTQASPPKDLAVEAAIQARAAAATAGFNDFESWLTTGGDDRSIILESGTNKYHIKPQPVDPAAVFRGSCTGNPPTARGYDAAEKMYNEKLKGLEGAELSQKLKEIFADQRERVARLLKVPEGTQVILVPSGSDAEYFPVAIAKALKKDSTPIVNGVTQVREIGAGSAPAAHGQYFSTHAPLIGELADGVEHLVGMSDVDGVDLVARERSGAVVDAAGQMEEFVQQSLKDGKYPIVHGVFGGKTGLRDTVMPGSLDGAETSLGVVDACQGRFTTEELHSWLAQDSLVLFTGSKFYQAPPFCGAILMSATVSAKLAETGPPPAEILIPDSLGGFVTDKELPECMESWKEQLANDMANNVGLALRWEAGLAGMEALESVPDSQRDAAVSEWADSVKNLVNSDPLLDAWCVERSIVSIRVSKKSGGWLSMSELRDLYRWMSLDVSGVVPEAADDEKAALSSPAFIGQPVDVSESHAIVRIALGVDSLLDYTEDASATLGQDEKTVRKLAAIANHFDTLKQSGL